MTVKGIDIQELDKRRVRLQTHLDSSKTTKERNRMGQFATPPELALQTLKTTKALLTSSEKVRFLDPAFGTGAFYGALLKTFTEEQIEQALGYEIDPLYGVAAQELWSETPLQLTLKDFTKANPLPASCDRANLIVCNPPYVRHHHLSSITKAHLQTAVAQSTGINLNGLSGLYCYFLLLAHEWLADDGIACWLIPSEFMDVNYGFQVKKYLLSKVKLIRIHRFDLAKSQFDDALVSSAVVWFKKQTTQNMQYKVQFSFGGTLEFPDMVKYIAIDQLSPREKWSRFSTVFVTNAEVSVTQQTPLRLSDLFAIKRGIATGANKFFILTAEQVQTFELPSLFLTPIFPSPRYIVQDEVKADLSGLPLIEKQLFLLNCDLPEQIIHRDHPTLWKYLEFGKRQGIHRRYLCRHRSPWYLQDKRSPAPLLCTYMGRNEHPFRFILNHSQAIAANVYLMLYPKQILQTYIDQNPALMHKIWQVICQIEPSRLIAEGRIYGGGLHKLEPKELSNTPIDDIREILPDLYVNQSIQMSLF